MTHTRTHVSNTKFGRFQVLETEAAMLTAHVHAGGPLKTVDHEPKVGVLDQEDLFAQGIDTSLVVAGAQKVDALGSCTAQATTAGLSNVLNEEMFLALIHANVSLGYGDVVGAEKWAIGFYHSSTDLTDEVDQEWPPTDCGSSGPYIVEEMQRLGLVSGATIAHGPQNIVSLLQKGGLLTGQPFLNAWMEPNSAGFIDGNGSSITLEDQIRQGVAGGHETYLSAIEELALSATGTVIPEKTIIRFRNSWDENWGDHGSYLAHLSTYVALGAYCDFRGLQPVAA